MDSKEKQIIVLNKLLPNAMFYMHEGFHHHDQNDLSVAVLSPDYHCFQVRCPPESGLNLLKQKIWKKTRNVTRGPTITEGQQIEKSTDREKEQP